MAAAAAAATYAQATSIETLSENTYSADFPREWCIGTGKLTYFVITAFTFVIHCISSSPFIENEYEHSQDRKKRPLIKKTSKAEPKKPIEFQKVTT